MSEPLPAERRTADELMEAAEQRLEATEHLPEALEELVGWSENEERTVRVTVDAHGALARLELAEEALTLGEKQLGAEIVRLAGQAYEATLVETVGTLSHALGDAETLDLARDLGLGDMIEPDAPVVPLPAAAGEAPPVPTDAAEPDDLDIQSFDFSQFRSDR